MYKIYYKEYVLVSVMSVESMKNSQFPHIKKMIYETLNASMGMKDDISQQSQKRGFSKKA
jgi:hypothetical protein